MATRSMKALSQRAIEELVSRSIKATSPILLPFEKDEEDADGFNMAVVFPIMVRAGGFMVASPSSPIAQAALEAVDCGLENIEPAVYHGTLQLETTRGRRLGEADAILVDFPWAAATAFSPSSAMKSLPPGEAKAIQFTKDNALGRPTRQSAEELATRWIGSTLDEETAQEYLTGEELEPVEEPGKSSSWGRSSFGRRGAGIATEDSRTGASSADASNRNHRFGSKAKSTCIVESAGNNAGNNRLVEAPTTGRISPSSCGKAGSYTSFETQEHGFRSCASRCGEGGRRDSDRRGGLGPDSSGWGCSIKSDDGGNFVKISCFCRNCWVPGIKTRCWVPCQAAAGRTAEAPTVA